ncbi:MAG: hypothetical protein ABIK31_02765 [candidate division WOR-3 bacterium]
MGFQKVSSIDELQNTSGYEGLKVFCESTDTVYQYFANKDNLPINNVSIVSTPNGPTTRWIGIEGKYKYNLLTPDSGFKTDISVDSITDLKSLLAYAGMLVYCKTVQTIYRLLVGFDLPANELTIIDSTAVSNGQWLAISGKFIYPELDLILSKLNSSAGGDFNGFTVRDEYVLLSNQVKELNFVGDSFQAVLDAPDKVTVSVGAPPPPANNIITFTLSPTVSEIGSTVNPLNFTWTVNQTPDSQSISPLIGTISPTVLSYSYTGGVSSNTTFTLTNIIGSNTSTKTTSISFRHKRYWFASTNNDFANGPKTYLDLLADSGFSSQPIADREEFATIRQTIKTYDATGGRYLYMMFPASFGTTSPQIQIGPFPVTISYVNNIPFTNESGYTTNYYVYRTTLQTGSSITVQIL